MWPEAVDGATFRSVNGFSNSYFGYGFEDDDLSRRLRIRGYRLMRNDEKTGR